MRRRFRSGGIWQAAGVLLVALALAVRLATPTGWMLAAGDGAPKLIICTGHSSVAADKIPGHQSSSDRGDHPCVFRDANAATAAPEPVAVPLTARVVFLDPARPPVVDQRPGQGLAAPPPPSQGPPHST